MSGQAAIQAGALCFKFDNVLAAFPPVFSSPGASGAYMFCDGIPFTIQTSADMKRHNSQQQVPVGPFLTETRITDPVPTLTPPNLVLATNAPWSYRFIRGSMGQILIYATDGAGGMGWLALATNSAAWGRKTCVLLPSQALAEARGVQWGVVFQDNTSGVGVSTQVFLPYFDNNTDGALLMTCIGGSSTGLVAASKLALPETTTTLMYHGAYDPAEDNPAPKTSALFADNFTYNPVSMAVNLTTTSIDPGGVGFASWVLALVGGAPSLSNVGHYMRQVCMDVVSDNCYNNEVKCTNFTSLTPRGLGCQAAARIDPDEANAAYQTLCGIDPVTGTAQSSTPAADSAVMTTPDCMCMNYTQSPFPQPGLPNKNNYAEFQEWVAENGVSYKSSGNTMCWLPSCNVASAGGGVITYSWPMQFKDPTKYTGKCPNSLYCIAAVQAETENGGTVSINTLNQCTQGGDGGAGPSQAPATATSSPSSASGLKKLTNSLVFRVCVAAFVIIVLMALTYFLFKPINRPAVRYVVVNN